MVAGAFAWVRPRSTSWIGVLPGGAGSGSAGFASVVGAARGQARVRAAQITEDDLAALRQAVQTRTASAARSAGAVRAGYSGLLTHAIAEGDAAARALTAHLRG